MSKTEVVECKDCSGMGEIDCPTCEDCDECGGSRVVNCETCDGEGYVDNNE